MFHCMNMKPLQSFLYVWLTHALLLQFVVILLTWIKVNLTRPRRQSTPWNSGWIRITTHLKKQQEDGIPRHFMQKTKQWLPDLTSHTQGGIQSMQCNLILNPYTKRSMLYLNRSPKPCSSVVFCYTTLSAMQQLMVALPRWNKSPVT